MEQTQEEDSPELSYAKQEFATHPTDCKIFKIPWDKSIDSFGVGFDMPGKEQSEEGILEHVAFIFDAFRLIPPVTLTGKEMYSEACEFLRDEQLTEPLKT